MCCSSLQTFIFWYSLNKSEISKCCLFDHLGGLQSSDSGCHGDRPLLPLDKQANNVYEWMWWQQLGGQLIEPGCGKTHKLASKEKNNIRTCLDGYADKSLDTLEAWHDRCLLLLFLTAVSLCLLAQVLLLPNKQVFVVVTSAVVLPPSALVSLFCLSLGKAFFLN